MTQHTHCRLITKKPVVAQTGLQVKLNFFMQMQQLGLSVMRSKPWGVFFPPGYEAPEGGDNNDLGGGGLFG